MDQIIDIMPFSAFVFVVSVSGISSLDAVQIPQWGHSKRTVTRVRSKNAQSSLHGNVGGFQEADVTWQLLRLSYSSELV
jgi:hypothetical protein